MRGRRDHTRLVLPPRLRLLWLCLSLIGGARWALAAPPAPANLMVVNAASYTGVVARGSIAAVFGDFNTEGDQPFSSQTRPLPWSLGGVRVTVNGRLVQLFFTSPAQINFLVPALTDSGVAVVKVTNADNTDGFGQVTVLDSAPGIFTATSSGRGTAAAVTTFDGLSYEDVVNPDGSERDLSPGTRAVPNYLVLYATGVRNGPSQALAVHIQGVPARVTFVGRAPGFDGLDQINAAIPSALSGSGTVTVRLTVAGRLANPVKVKIGGAVPPLVSLPVVPGQTMVGALTADSAVDKATDGSDRTYFYDAYHLITTSPNTSLAIDLRSAQFDPLIRVFRQTAEVPLEFLASDDNAGGLGVAWGVDKNALLLTVLKDPGDYIIKVTSSVADGNGMGSYSLRLTTDVAQPIGYGFQIADAQITSSDIQTSAGVFLDAYWFSGRKGEQIQVNMISPAFDAYLMLIDSSGERIAEDDNSGGGTGAQIVTALPGDDIYLIIATPFAIDRTGNYTLTLNKTGAAPPGN